MISKMIKILLKLAGIFVLAYTAVHLGYAQLEKELLHRSCFDIAGLPTPGPAIQHRGDKEEPQPNAEGPPAELRHQHTANTAPGLPLEDQSTTSENREETLPTDLPGDVPAVGQTIDYENPDFQVIIRRNIFQLTQQEEPVITEEQPTLIEKQPVKEVQTALNLTLLGTVTGDKQAARAIIVEDNKNEQKLYQIGDAVQGAIIESIERGKVILDVFGAQEALLMKKREGGGPGLPFITRSPRPPAPQPPQIEEELEDMDDFEDPEEDDSVEEKSIKTQRRPPAIRPHRRVNFRRNPIRNPSDMEEDMPIDELDEEVLPDLDRLPEEE
ncbi:type II secretion system protein N [Candidatus Electrothrix sp.]|uniref:type II secretion system protein N n=1 Tax=Candidatus Electrothrix sp. TaxID=2170559 RepID=UPI0040568338